MPRRYSLQQYVIGFACFFISIDPNDSRSLTVIRLFSKVQLQEKRCKLLTPSASLQANASWNSPYVNNGQRLADWVHQGYELQQSRGYVRKYMGNNKRCFGAFMSGCQESPAHQKRHELYC